jgi:hypothetical protein
VTVQEFAEDLKESIKSWFYDSDPQLKEVRPLDSDGDHLRFDVEFEDGQSFVVEVAKHH